MARDYEAKKNRRKAQARQSEAQLAPKGGEWDLRLRNLRKSALSPRFGSAP